MDEYITKASAVSVLLYNQDEYCSAVIPEMEDIPCEDVAPVVHAKWNEHHCTACGCQAVTFKNPSGETIYVETPRCPACGAIMDDEQEG